MGREPIHPIGQCFESTAHEALHNAGLPDDIFICHGIGLANMPGQVGLKIGHAWIEVGAQAYDTTWGVKMRSKYYHRRLNIEYVVRYRFRQFMLRWANEGYPGPWDAKIKAVVEARCTDVSTARPLENEKIVKL